MRKLGLALLLGMTMCSLTACGGSSSYSGDGNYNMAKSNYYGAVAAVEGFNLESKAQSADYDYYEEDSIEEAGEAAGSSSTYRENVKLIRNVSMSLNTKSSDLKPIFEEITAKAIDLDGYVEDSSINTYEYSTQGDIVVRLPAGNVDTFLGYIEESDFEIVSLNDGVEDVTLQYSDITTRLQVLNTQKEKYMEYLEQATNVSEIMEIESKLQEVIYDIESTNSRLLLLSSKINYSTIRISLEYSKYRTTSMLGKIGRAFSEVGDNLIEGLTTAIEVLTYAFIPMIAWIFMLTVGLRFFLFIFKVGRKGTSKFLKTKPGSWVKKVAKEVKDINNTGEEKDSKTEVKKKDE